MWVISSMPSEGPLPDCLQMSNSILGAGIIGLPFAMAEAGFFTGIVLLIVLCWVTDWTIRLVILDAKLCGKDSYIGVRRRAA